MVMDEEGNIFVVYLMFGIVFVYNKDGFFWMKIFVEVSGKGSMNLIWGGEDFKILYIVESELVFIFIVSWYCKGII